MLCAIYIAVAFSVLSYFCWLFVISWFIIFLAEFFFCRNELDYILSASLTSIDSFQKKGSFYSHILTAQFVKILMEIIVYMTTVCVGIFVFLFPFSAKLVSVYIISI